MRRRPVYLVARQPRRNYRAWVATGVGALAIVVGLTLSWNLLLCLLVGAVLGALTYAAKF